MNIIDIEREIISIKEKIVVIKRKQIDKDIINDLIALDIAFDSLMQDYIKLHDSVKKFV